LKGLKFFQYLLKGCKLRITHYDTGFKLTSETFALVDQPALKPGTLKIFEELAFIQEKVQIPLSIPSSEIISKETNLISAIAKTIKTGKKALKLKDWTITIDREAAKELLKKFEQGKPSPFTLTFDDSANILNRTIPLGPVRVECVEVYMEQKDINSMRDSITKNDSQVSMRFKPCPNAPITVYYDNWIPGADQK